MIGVDLFAGAGGMSLGALEAGLDVKVAVEVDKHACATYAANFPATELVHGDVRSVRGTDLPAHRDGAVLFGGLPCQGLSTSNQRDRGYRNPRNWLFSEFLRIAKEWRPDWVVLENVRGILETANGVFMQAVVDGLKRLDYGVDSELLNAADFGVPQRRARVFVVARWGGRPGMLQSPQGQPCVTVKDAIFDLPELENGAAFQSLPYRADEPSRYARQMRGNLKATTCHLVTRNAQHVVERYKHIPQGGNWKDIPPALMANYTETEKCHTGIYHRLREDAPSIVIGNYRKNMIIHPRQNRGLSVREAARIQSFPDSFDFRGSIGFQQQQVGNAVPPLLARGVFEALVRAGS